MYKELLGWIVVIGVFAYFIGTFAWGLCKKDELEYKSLVAEDKYHSAGIKKSKTKLSKSLYKMPTLLETAYRPRPCQFTPKYTICTASTRVQTGAISSSSCDQANTLFIN